MLVIGPKSSPSSPIHQLPRREVLCPMPEEPLAQLAKEAAALKRLVDLYAKAAAAAGEGHYLDAGQVLRRNADLSRRLGRALRDAGRTLPEAGLESIVK